jgi:Kef-type K+ transport system membrane component KefB
MFSVVIFGMALAALGLFQNVMQSESFLILSKMGLLFFLFTIGLDLDLDQIRKLGRYIFFGDILLTLTEGLLLGTFFYFVFPEFVGHSVVVALIAGIAFGTVGEVVLLAILKEFGLEKTRFGQLALGIGVFDDVFEILALALVIAITAIPNGNNQAAGMQSTWVLLLSLFGIISATILLALVGKVTRKFLEKIQGESFVIPFLIFFVIFAFIYLGARGFENMSVVAAIFSGIAVKQIMPEKFIRQYQKPIFFVGNMFLGPFFFLSLGGKMSFESILTYPLLILIIMVISLSTRVLVSYLLFRKLLGKRESLVMGVGLTSKFSTSVITENLMFTSGLIAQPLYSAIMAAYILLKPIIVGIFAGSVAKIKDSILQQEKLQQEQIKPGNEKFQTQQGEII